MSCLFLPPSAGLTGYTIPRLASAADISNWLSVLVLSLSKYRNVVSNCSSCAGVRLVIFRDTICMPCQSSQREENNAHLVIKERNFLRYILDNQLELEPEVLTGEHRIIIFIDIGITARLLCFCDPLQGI